MQDNNQLYQCIHQIILEARGQAAKTANWALVKSNWLIGQSIVEEEQAVNGKVEYGITQIEQFVVRLSAEFVLPILVVICSICGNSTWIFQF